MRKYITCLIGILCIAFTSVCFAGRNVITDYSGRLISISVIDKDGKEYQIPGASGPISLNTNINAYATVGEGKDLPNGEYTAIKYVLENKYTVAGKVILDDGEYGSVRITDGKLIFKKGYAPAPCTWKNLDGPGGDPDDGFVSEVSGNKETVTEDVSFTLKENDVNILTFDITLEYLWFGVAPYWNSFSDSEYVKDAANAGDEDFTRVDSDTISSPMIDPPEVVISLNGKQLN